MGISRELAGMEEKARGETRLKKTVLVPFVVVQALILAALILALYSEQERRLDSTLGSRYADTSRFFTVVMKEEKEMLVSVIESLVLSKKLVAAIQTGKREDLLASAEPASRQLAKYGFSGLYFTDSRLRVVLRVDEPARSEDAVSDWFSVNAARTRKVVAGIAVGGSGLPALKAAYPVMVGPQMTGLVGLDLDLHVVARDFRKLLGVEAAFLFDKSMVPLDKARELSAGAEWGRYNKFLLITSLEKKYMDLLERSLDEEPGGDERGKIVGLRGESWLLGFVPLKDVKGMSLGSMVTFQDVTPDMADFSRDLGLISGLIVLGGAYLFIFLYAVLSRTENALDKALKDLRRGEEQLRESEEKYHRIFDSSPEGIVLLDERGKILDANSRLFEWLGAKREDIDGKTILDIPYLPPQSKDVAAANLVMRMKGGEVPPYDLEFVNASGETLIGRINATRLRYDRGRTARDLVVIVDITTRRKMEDALKKLVKLKDDFIGIVSHDLRSPLTVILSCVELMTSFDNYREGLSAEHLEFLQAIHEEGSRMNDYLNKLLNLAFLESGKFTLKRETIPLSALVEDSSRNYASLIEKKEIVLERAVPDDLYVNVDETLFIQVLNNLISNAVKFTGHGGRVKITATRDGEHIKLGVSDTGVGMSAEKKDQIFGEFSRHYSQGTEGERGTGLGLSICRRILDAHGFSITVSSEEGAGTEFVISLPLAEPAARSA
jgi:PAS domain S-box-containing protein